MAIPNIVHRIWIQGFDKLPPDVSEKHDRVKSLNPAYTVMEWDDASLRHLMKSFDERVLHLYDHLDDLRGHVSVVTSKSDVGRFVVANVYGGWYVDMDFSCSIRLDEIKSRSEKPKKDIYIADNTYPLLAFMPMPMYKPKYYAGFFGIVPNHALWKAVWADILAASSRNTIGTALDRYLQGHSTRIAVISEDLVSSHVSCRAGKCFAPAKSSWFYGRHVVVAASCSPFKWHILLLCVMSLVTLFAFTHGMGGNTRPR